MQQGGGEGGREGKGSASINAIVSTIPPRYGKVHSATGGGREKEVPASMLLFQPFHPLINM